MSRQEKGLIPAKSVTHPMIHPGVEPGVLFGIVFTCVFCFALGEATAGFSALYKHSEVCLLQADSLKVNPLYAPAI